MRRTVDVIVTVLALVVLAPVLLLVTSAILLTMGRPVLFRQPRAGQHGRVFELVKFRSMRPPRYPGEDEHARTPLVGRFLRASSLDELPQLWNILRGNMTLIGPRPALPLQVEYYTPRDRGRLAVRPGLTGWAQVNGRNAISWASRIELDLWYIQNSSLWLDIKIILLTVLRLVRPVGVEGVTGINEGYRTADGLVVDVWGARPVADEGTTLPRSASPSGTGSPATPRKAS